MNCRSNGSKGRYLCRKLLTGQPCTVREMDLTLEKNVFCTVQLCRKLQAELPCRVQEMDLTVEKNVFLNCARNIKEHLDKLVRTQFMQVSGEPTRCSFMHS